MTLDSTLLDPDVSAGASVMILIWTNLNFGLKKIRQSGPHEVISDQLDAEKEDAKKMVQEKIRRLAKY